jgi:hypothetical protein
MQLVRTLSSNANLSGKLEGRRISLIPETFAEAIWVHDFYDKKKIPEELREKLTVLYEKYTSSGDMKSVLNDVKNYLADNRAPVLRFSVGDNDVEKLERSVRNLSIEIEAACKESYRTKCTISYSLDVLEHQW